MTYIDKNLISDEQILFRTKKSKIIFLFPIVWTLFSIYASAYMSANAILVNIVWVPWLMALIFWVYVWFEYTFSEFAVTNKRVIMREGFFNRHVTELRLSTISQVNIIQGVFGQLFNYGTVAINAFGVGDAYTLIAQPQIFQKSVNEQLDKIVR